MCIHISYRRQYGQQQNAAYNAMLLLMCVERGKQMLGVKSHPKDHYNCYSGVNNYRTIILQHFSRFDSTCV